MATDDGWLGRRLASTEEVVARMTDPKLSSCLHNPALERQRTTARAGMMMKVKRAANSGGGALCEVHGTHPRCNKASSSAPPGREMVTCSCVLPLVVQESPAHKNKGPNKNDKKCRI